MKQEGSSERSNHDIEETIKFRRPKSYSMFFKAERVWTDGMVTSTLLLFLARQSRSAIVLRFRGSSLLIGEKSVDQVSASASHAGDMTNAHYAVRAGNAHRAVNALEEIFIGRMQSASIEVASSFEALSLCWRIKLNLSTESCQH